MAQIKYFKCPNEKCTKTKLYSVHDITSCSDCIQKGIARRVSEWLKNFVGCRFPDLEDIGGFVVEQHRPKGESSIVSPPMCSVPAARAEVGEEVPINDYEELKDETKKLSKPKKQSADWGFGSHFDY